MGSPRGAICSTTTSSPGRHPISMSLSSSSGFSNHNTLTDVITFPLSKRGEQVQAEVYISAERVKENAKIFHASFLKELHRVIFHGALHLCGYSDKTNKQTMHMRKLEDYYLHK